jgi:ribosomal protein S18 acetylase RimI-like enzyme
MCSSFSATVRDFIFSSDYSKVIDLWKTAGEGIQLRRSDEPDEILKKLTRDPDLFLVAEYDDQIVGAVLGAFDGRRGMMYHLAVRKEFRNNGIGTLLTNELEKRLLAKGCIRYYLLVTKDNKDAQTFYENSGWEKLDLFAYAKNLD